MGLSTLDEGLNIISDLVIPPLEDDVDVIQKLDDEPNDVGGLSSSELKKKFDEAGNIIKKYLNETLVPQLSDTVAEAEVRRQDEAARQENETARQEAERNRESAEADRRATFGSVLEQAEGFKNESAKSAGNAAASALAAKDHKDKAEEAQQKAELATTRKPFPNPETGTWWVWDASSSVYIDSGEPYDGNLLYVTFEVDEQGVLYARIPDGYHGPTFAINDVGELEVFYDASN